METLTLRRPPLYRIPLSQRMPKAFLARLDSLAPLTNRSRLCMCRARYVVSRLCAEPLICGVLMC